MSTKILKELEPLAEPIDSVEPHPENAWKGDVGTIQESLATNGQYTPIIVWDQKGFVIRGNHTWKAAKLEGWDRIAMVRLKLTKREATKILLVDNRANEKGEWDEQALHGLLSGLGTQHLEGTGYTTSDVGNLLDSINRSKPSQRDPDDVPARPKKALTQEGDIWELGDHLLICGNARRLDDYERLLGDFNAEQVDAVITDPPYGVEVADLANLRADREWEPMAGDELDDAALYDLTYEALGCALTVTAPGAPIYVAHSDVGGTIARNAFRDAGWRLAQILVWVKDRMVLGRQDYQWRHEPILYGWRPGGAHRWYGDFNKTTVLERPDALEELDAEELRDLVRQLTSEIPGTVVKWDRPSSSKLHPTMKPVGLWAKLMLNSSRRGDVVLDPFGGSGTTLIAAEQHERRGRLIELDPGFCDVIAERWQDISGGKAKRRKRR